MNYKNIILTSCGIRNDDFKKRFYEVISKHKVKKAKVLYITTAVDGEKEDNRAWVDKEYQTILDLGIKESNITEYKIGSYDVDVSKYDIIYMLGGNTIYLLYMIKKYNFGEKIREAIEKDVIYIGSSAGSQVMGTTIEFSTPFNENNVGLTDFAALCLFNGVIIPHANKKSDDYINRVKEIYQGKVLLLYDGDGVIM